MPRGYPETVTCPNCKDGMPADYNFCSTCGSALPVPRSLRKIKEAVKKAPPKRRANVYEEVSDNIC